MFGPAVDPIGVIERTVRAEFDIGGKRFPEELFVAVEFEGSAFWLEGESVNAAAGAAAKIAKEEMAAVFLGKAGAGIMCETGWAVAEIGEGRDDVGGLIFELGIPEFLGVPWAAAGRRVEMLVTDTPAAIAAFDEMNPSGAIATIGIVVSGEKISEIVEGEFLRIAEAAGEDFEVCAVRFTAQDDAFIGVIENATFFVGDIQSAIANGKIKTAVGSHDEAVEIVTKE